MRASKNQWAISPETIISHHFRLAKGIPHVVDTTPPLSMFNSPISVHYLPKRASSADPFKRKVLSKSQRELTEFVNGRDGNTHPLRLPLPIRSSLTDLVKPKLLENRNYQPPRRRPPQKKQSEKDLEDLKNEEKSVKINEFKDKVLTELIQNEAYSDQRILASIRSQMENLAGVVPWSELEEAADELMTKIGIDPSLKEGRRHSTSRKKDRRNQKPPMPFRVEPIGSRNSLESLSSPSSSSSKASSSSSSSSYSASSSIETNSAASS